MPLLLKHSWYSERELKAICHESYDVPYPSYLILSLIGMDELAPQGPRMLIAQIQVDHNLVVCAKRMCRITKYVLPKLINTTFCKG